VASLNAAIRDIPLPLTMRDLPIDARGFPVPWFVAWLDGEPDFRVVRPEKRVWALKQELCWVCGKPLRRMKVSVVGPMCTVNRISSEPPSHLECARYAAKACPFLANPRMRRNEKNLTEEAESPGGIVLERNPGVAALWCSTQMSKPFYAQGGGWLFTLGPPERVEWYARGRAATRAEVQESIGSGLPVLAALAAAEGPEAVKELDGMVAKARRLLPA
jgi:hypothetical protein